MLKLALEESRRQKQARLEWIEAERERLTHNEKRAVETLDRSHDEVPRVYKLAQKQLETILQEKEEFERKVAIELSDLNQNNTQDELAELCDLAGDVPRLWHHPAVTNPERKEILRCLIEKIIVAATKQRIDATIVWKSGDETPIAIWRGIGRYNLVRELHAQGLTVFEMRERLATGMTSTGQSFKVTIGRLYVIHRRLGLTANRFRAEYLALREKALTLNREGRSLDWIAEHFNEQGYKSGSGTSWTRDMVCGLLKAQGKTPLLLQDIHRQAITEAKARGLNYKQMATEFNEKGIRRRDGQPWKPVDVKKRWADLNKLNRKRAQERRSVAKSAAPTTETT
jgi:hypothetical protein